MTPDTLVETAVPPVPLTVEGASVLHQMMRFRRPAWRALSAGARSEVLQEAGGVLGLAAGYAGIRAILRLSPGIPRIGAGGSNVGLDWRVLGFTLALSILTGILFGLVPAMQSSRADLSSMLKESRPCVRFNSPRSVS